MINNPPDLTEAIGREQINQIFGASGVRLRNIIVTPIAGEILRIYNHSGGAFSGLINAAGSGGLTATNVPYDGDSNEDMFSGLFAYDGSAYWGQIILHNITRGNSRKVVSADRTNNVIVTTSSTDDWADNDVIDCESQMVESGVAQMEFVDIDISDFVGTEVDAILLFVAFQNNTADYNVQNALYIHPYVAYDYGKRIWATAKLGNESTSEMFIMSVVDQKITIAARSDAAGDFIIVLSVKGTIEFADT